MKNKIFKCIALCIVILLAVGIYYRVTSAQGKLTGGEFVIKLVESLSLDYKLQEGATVDDYINLLKEEGIGFPADFNPAKPITREQKADLLSQVLAIEEVEMEKAQLRMEVYRDKAVIKKIVGNVMIKREGADEWVPAKLDMELTEGDYIKTGPDSTVFLRVGVAGRIEIRENSELLLKNLATQIDKKSENILIYLAMGESSVDARYIHKGTTFEVHTPTTVAAVRGTIYVVKVRPTDGKTEIREGR